MRLSQEVLRMSGLNGKSKVNISARKDRIVITKSSNLREGWEEQIDKLLASDGDPGKEFSDMKAAANDGLEDLPWDGPSFEEWQQAHDKLS